MQTIRLDISAKISTQVLYAKQRDVGSKFAVEVYDNGIPYTIPGSSTFSLWYDGKNGRGNYSDINGKSAFVASNNKVTVELDPQMLHNYGDGVLCLVMNVPEAEKRGLWNISYSIEPIPGVDNENTGGGECNVSTKIENDILYIFKEAE